MGFSPRLPRLRPMGLPVVTAAFLMGCASPTPTVPAAPEALGPGYLLAVQTDPLTGDLLMVAVKPTDHAGKLHVCGTFVAYGNPANETADRNAFHDSTLSIETPRQGQSVRLSPSFMTSYFAARREGEQDQLLAAAQAGDLPMRQAGCVETTVEWRPEYLRATIVLGAGRGQTAPAAPFYVFVPYHR